MLVSLFLCLVGSVFANDSATELYKAGINLIPYPQEAKLAGGDFVLGAKAVIVVDKDASEKDRFAAGQLARGLKEDWGITARVADAATDKSIILTRKTAPEKLCEQGYHLSVTPHNITIQANGEAGLFYGTRTLLQIIQAGHSGPYVKGMEIIDWPDIPQRAVHYDTKHHQDKAEYVRGFIRDLAHYKINILMWEWEDKFAYKSHPEVGAPGAFTTEEMQELTRYAQQYHIQIVPLVQGLGHVSFILKWPQNAHLREIAASNWQFCPLKDGSYDLLLDLWKEAMEATPGSEYLHIGCDETYELGQGVECGCKAKAEEIGKRGLMKIFLDRNINNLSRSGRKIITWSGYGRGPNAGAPKAFFGNYVYDPNPGIEHLFLPYFYRIRRGKETLGCLENSYKRIAPAAASGTYDMMINTSWDDSGLHNQVWMMTFVNSAENSWNGKAPVLDEFINKYFTNYYGPKVKDMRELWQLFNDGSYYYMDTFERKVWHWGDVGKTHLPDLPRTDSLEHDPFWKREYKEITQRSKEQLARMDRALTICRANLEIGVKHSYDFEIFITIAELIKHTCQTYLDLAQLEDAITRAHRQRFASHRKAYQAMEQAVEIIEKNLAERDKVFTELVDVWEKARLPKGMSTADKKFFHRQDRARHYAFRRADMTYLICDEQMLGLENYLKKLREYMDWYKQTYL
jgi:hypothetical protein